jgi:hypothetical protein
MIISIYAEKVFEKVQHAFKMKALVKLGIEGILYITIKPLYSKLITNIILMGINGNFFPIKSEGRQGCPLSQLLVNIVLEFLTTAIRQEKKIKVIQIRKEEFKLSILADDKILYLKASKAPKSSNRKLKI